MNNGKAARLQGWEITVLRVAIGTIFLINGGHKLSPKGFSEAAHTLSGTSLGQLESSLSLLIVVAAAVELVGGVALVLGLFTRWVSMLLAVGMAVDILVVHLPGGFFIGDGGYEYALLRLASTAALVIAGPGKVALDNILASRGNTMLARLLR